MTYEIKPGRKIDAKVEQPIIALGGRDYGWGRIFIF